MKLQIQEPEGKIRWNFTALANFQCQTEFWANKHQFWAYFSTKNLRNNKYFKYSSFFPTVIQKQEESIWSWVCAQVGFLVLHQSSMFHELLWGNNMYTDI